MTLGSAQSQFPRATWLSVADGRVSLGVVLDTRLQVRGASPSPAFAFDTEDRFVGEFPDRRVAAAALCARRQHDEATR